MWMALLVIGTFFNSNLAFAGSSKEYVQCSTCHGSPDVTVPHEPFVDDCMSCHVPHEEQTSNPYRLVKEDINSLCLSCHEGQLLRVYGTRGHIIDNHPLAGPRDRLYPNRPMSCASCHNPHGSNQEKLFRYDVRPRVTPYNDNKCAVCHWEIAIGTKPPTPPWGSLDE